MYDAFPLEDAIALEGEIAAATELTANNCRIDLVGERAREKNRVEKLLEDAGIKVSVMASDVFGVSGWAMLDALVAGQRDPGAGRPGRGPDARQDPGTAGGVRRPPPILSAGRCAAGGAAGLLLREVGRR